MPYYLKLSLLFLAVAVLADFVLAGAVVWLERRRRMDARETQEDVAEAYVAEELQVADAGAQSIAAPTKKVPFLSLITRKAIVTDNEREFLSRLLTALPDYHIFPQVAFSAILKPVHWLSEEEQTRVFRKFAQKRLDYVVCQRDTLDIVAIIELDDKSHTNAQKDWRRDGLLSAGGYSVIRYSSKAKPSIEAIAAQFKTSPVPKRSTV